MNRIIFISDKFLNLGIFFNMECIIYFVYNVFNILYILLIDNFSYS